MSNKEEQQRTPCVLEISDKGIKMVDKSKPGVSLISCIVDYEDKTCIGRTATVFPVMSISTI